MENRANKSQRIGGCAYTARRETKCLVSKSPKKDTLEDAAHSCTRVDHQESLNFIDHGHQTRGVLATIINIGHERLSYNFIGAVVHGALGCGQKKKKL